MFNFFVSKSINRKTFDDLVSVIFYSQNDTDASKRSLEHIKRCTEIIFSQKACFCVLAKRTEEIVGICIGCNATIVGKGIDSLYIADIAVSESFRRKGIGYELVNKVIDCNKNLQYRGLYADVTLDSRSNRLFHKIGFCEIIESSKKDFIRMFYKL